MKKENVIENNVKTDNKIYKIISEFVKLYKEKLKFKHIIIFFIMIILFFILLNGRYNSFKMLTPDEILTIDVTSISFFESIKSKFFMVFVIIFAGISPFLYLPVIGVLSSYNLAVNTSMAFVTNQSGFVIVLMCIGAIIQILGLSLAVATGMYYCTLSSKKFRYSQRASFGIADVKKAIYEIRKNEKKVNQIKEEQKNKAKKMENLNVKVPYIMFLVSFIISFILVIIGTVFLK